MSDDENKTKEPADRDSDNESAEDADFQDSDEFSSSSSDESDVPKGKKRVDKDLDSGDELTIAKRKKRRIASEADDLILTRAQKRAKYVSATDDTNIRADEVKAPAKVTVQQDKPEDLDAIWKQLNSKAAADTTTTKSVSAVTGDTVIIKRSYEFAGQLVAYTHEITVLIIQGRKGGS